MDEGGTPRFVFEMLIQIWESWLYKNIIICPVEKTRVAVFLSTGYLTWQVLVSQRRGSVCIYKIDLGVL